MEQSQNSAAEKQSNPVMKGVIHRQAFEDLATCVQTFFNVDGTQLEAGEFRGQIDFIAGKDILLYRENYSHRSHLECELLGKRFGFSIPLLTAKGKFLGEQVDDSRIASSVSGEAFDHVMERGFEQLIVLLDHERLLKKAEQAGLSESALEAISPGRKWKALKTRPSDIQSIRQNFTTMLNAVIRGEMNLSADDFEKVIFDSVLPVIDGGGYRIDRQSSAILVRRAIDVCEPVSGPVGISELSTTLNASPRTLQLAFQKVMGTTPHNFFHRRRMTKARMALLKADSRESRVTDIANHHGFSELGRFSVQYRELFGESPKVTLRRNLTSSVAIPFPSSGE
jgi:AraC-like DNA-binding protein